MLGRRDLVGGEIMGSEQTTKIIKTYIKMSKIVKMLPPQNVVKTNTIAILQIKILIFIIHGYAGHKSALKMLFMYS